MIIGRKEELATLASLKQSSEPAFVAVYGRRRVGKTYLIREFFNDTIHFKLTGIANVELLQQLGNFHSAFIRHFPEFEDPPMLRPGEAATEQTKRKLTL